MSSEGLVVLTGNANPKPAGTVVKHPGTPLGRTLVGRFSDDEIQVKVQESVRGKHVFILQSTCAPTNDNLMELMVMIDALKCASVHRITVATPYFGYVRQGCRPRLTRVAITARVVANMLEVVGVERVLTMDPHVDQTQDFSDIPVNNIYASLILLEDLYKKDHEDLLVVSPNVGGVVRVRALIEQLGVDLATTDKRRPKASIAEVMSIIGEVDGHDCVITDDMIDTGSTLYKVAQALKEHGARRVLSYRTHPVLPGGATTRIADSALDEVVVTDTISLREDAIKCGKVRQLSTASLLAKTFICIVHGDSIISLPAE